MKIRNSGKAALFTLYFTLFFLIPLFLLSCARREQTPAPHKKQQPASITDDTLFTTKGKKPDDLPVYGCVRLRRGDILELTGEISLKNTGAHSNTVITTAAGRVFILTGAKIPAPGSGAKKIKGSILFEGNEERLPELAVLSYKPVKYP